MRLSCPKQPLVSILWFSICLLGLTLPISQQIVPIKSGKSLEYDEASNLFNGSSSSTKNIQKCSRQSVILSRQMLISELETINHFNPFWFNDFDRDELLESQKQSLSNIVMSGSGTKLLNSDGHPLMEIEAINFRPINHLNLRKYHTTSNSTTLGALSHQHQTLTSGSNNNFGQMQLQLQPQPISIKLIRRHQDRCHLSGDKAQFVYVIGLAVGPMEQNLDVVYNLPVGLRLSQPIEWRLAQISILIPRLTYEITLKQVSNYQLDSNLCPIELTDVTFSGKSPITIMTSGLASNNQTRLQIDRLFGDYTRPAISSRLKQILRFHLASKSLPLQVQ